MWRGRKGQHNSFDLNDDAQDVKRPINRLIHTIRHFPHTRSSVGTSSFTNLIDELESFCPHGLPVPSSVELTQSSSTRKGFSRKYLNLRLYPSYGKSPKCDSKLSNQVRTSESFESPGPIANTCSVKNLSNLRRKCNLPINKNQEKLLKKSDNKYLKQNKNSSKSDQVHNLKSKSNDQLKTHSLIPKDIKTNVTPPFNEEKTIVSSRYRGCRPKEKSMPKTKPRSVSTASANDENSSLESKCLKNNIIRKCCSKSGLASKRAFQSNIIINDEQLSQDHSSVVKNLTNYWNNLLNSEYERLRLDSDNSDTNGCRGSKSLELITKQTSQCVEKNNEFVRDESSLHARPISESNLCENTLPANLKNEFEVNSETAVKVLQTIVEKLKLCPNCCLQSDQINLSSGLKALVCLMVVSSQTENEETTRTETSLRSQENKNNSNNKLCLKFPTLADNNRPSHFQTMERNLSSNNKLYLKFPTVADNKRLSLFQTMERSESRNNKLYLKFPTFADNNRSSHFQTMERNTSNILAIQGVNLDKVKKALMCLMLLKEHLWMQFVFHNSCLPTGGRKAKQLSSHNFTIICEEEIIYDYEEFSSDEEDLNEDDLKLWSKCKKSLSNIAIYVDELITPVFDHIVQGWEFITAVFDHIVPRRESITSVFDQIVLHRESIECTVKITYQILVSFLVWRVIIMDMIKK